MIYQRRELWLLLVFVAALAVGSVVQHLRHGFPELADRLESVEPEEFPAPPSRSVPHADGGGVTVVSRKLVRGDRLNVNQAPAADLQRLPGIGPTLAQRIVEAREQHGRFHTPDDLLSVPGIGAKKLDAIKALITVDPPGDG